MNDIEVRVFLIEFSFQLSIDCLRIPIVFSILKLELNVIGGVYNLSFYS